LSAIEERTAYRGQKYRISAPGPEYTVLQARILKSKMDCEEKEKQKIE
jgi:hypothetical protein